MTTANHRKPDTPLSQFFLLGKYDKPLPVKVKVERSAEPDVSALLKDRNPDRINHEINVKPIT